MIKALIDLILQVTEEEYDYFLKESSALDYFLNGGCYDFVKIMSYFFEEGQVVINETLDHAAFLLGDKIYDASGEVCFNYHLASQLDLLYMEEYYGIPEKKYLKGNYFYQLIIPKVVDCNLIISR